MKLMLGSIIIECDPELGNRLHPMICGYEEGVYTIGYEYIAELAQAVSEGLDGDRAVLRALALKGERNHEFRVADTRHKAAEAERAAAGMHLATERLRTGGKS